SRSCARALASPSATRARPSTPCRTSAEVSAVRSRCTRKGTFSDGPRSATGATGRVSAAAPAAPPAASPPDRTGGWGGVASAPSAVLRSGRAASPGVGCGVAAEASAPRSGRAAAPGSLPPASSGEPAAFDGEPACVPPWADGPAEPDAPAPASGRALAAALSGPPDVPAPASPGPVPDDGVIPAPLAPASGAALGD